MVGYHPFHLKEPDPDLGDLTLSSGGPMPLRFGIRLAAGFDPLALLAWEVVAKAKTASQVPIKMRRGFAKPLGTQTRSWLFGTDICVEQVWNWIRRILFQRQCLRKPSFHLQDRPPPTGGHGCGVVEPASGDCGEDRVCALGVGSRLRAGSRLGHRYGEASGDFWPGAGTVWFGPG